MKQMTSFLLLANSTISSNNHTLFSGLSDGVNYQAGARFMVGPRTYLRLLYRHQDLGHQTFDFFDGQPITTKASLREYMFLTGRHAPVFEKSSVRSVGYAEFGLSVMDHRLNFHQYSSTESITKVGLVLQGGLLFLLSDKFALDASLGATWKSGFSETKAGGLLLGARAGITLMY